MYFDPGFGGMLVQVIVALIATGGALLFSFRRKISALFSKNKKSDTQARALPKNTTNTEDDAIDSLSDKE